MRVFRRDAYYWKRRGEMASYERDTRDFLRGIVILPMAIGAVVLYVMIVQLLSFLTKIPNFIFPILTLVGIFYYIKKNPI